MRFWKSYICSNSQDSDFAGGLEDSKINIGLCQTLLLKLLRLPQRLGLRRETRPLPPGGGRFCARGPSYSSWTSSSLMTVADFCPREEWCVASAIAITTAIRSCRSHERRRPSLLRLAEPSCLEVSKDHPCTCNLEKNALAGGGGGVGRRERRGRREESGRVCVWEERRERRCVWGGWVGGWVGGRGGRERRGEGGEGVWEEGGVGVVGGRGGGGRRRVRVGLGFSLSLLLFGALSSPLFLVLPHSSLFLSWEFPSLLSLPFCGLSPPLLPSLLRVVWRGRGRRRGTASKSVLLSVISRILAMRAIQLTGGHHL